MTFGTLVAYKTQLSALAFELGQRHEIRRRSFGVAEITKKLIMKQWTVLSAVAAVMLAATFSANAQTTLSEVIFNEDGTPTDEHPNTSSPISAPGVTVSGFGNSGVPSAGPPYYLSGLGTLQYTVTGAGPHDFISFLDDEADYANGFAHDYGFVGDLAGQPSYLSYEIGNPGPVGNNAYNSGVGDDELANGNDTPLGDTDISFALGFDFTLAAGQTATIDLSLSSTVPSSGFYLGQTNVFDNGADAVYYSGLLSITSPSAPGVPDNGATWIFMLLGLAGLAMMIRFESKFSKVSVD